MKGKTLYISDLDGTLLQSNQTLSKYTVDTVNSLVKQGMNFSYATARSYITASKVTGGISQNIPVIVYNGAFVMESITQKRLLTRFFDPGAARLILDELLTRDIYPIVYSFIDGAEKFSWCPELASEGMRAFQETRRGDVRGNPVIRDELYRGDIFYFTCIDSPEKLLPVYELYKNRFQCIYHVDIYTGYQWLEILPAGVTKASAIEELKRLLDCERTVVFGDGKNDIPMFEAADECYAVENAHPELKAIATGIIESNNNDGVAKWLKENFTAE